VAAAAAGDAIVEGAGEPVHGHGGGSAENHGEGDIGEVRIAQRNVEQAAEGDIQEIAGRMGLMLGDVELAESEGELHGVPVVEHARPIGPPGEEGEGGEARPSSRCPRPARDTLARDQPTR
jgi:hypothetical protein